MLGPMRFLALAQAAEFRELTSQGVDETATAHTLATSRGLISYKSVLCPHFNY
jgi:hypothetical protein